VFKGEARITGPGRVEVAGQTMQTDRIISQPAVILNIPAISGLQEAGYWTNREATTLSALPASVAILGGGPVGVELGQLYAASVSGDAHPVGRSPRRSRGARTLEPPPGRAPRRQDRCPRRLPSRARPRRPARTDPYPRRRRTDHGRARHRRGRPGSTTSNSKPWESNPVRAASSWTGAAAPATAFGRSATPPALCRSPMSGCTRHASPPPNRRPGRPSRRHGDSTRRLLRPRNRRCRPDQCPGCRKRHRPRHRRDRAPRDDRPPVDLRT